VRRLSVAAAALLLFLTGAHAAYAKVTLASAALTVERDLREEGWAALSLLLALVAEKEGPLDERVLALDGRPHFAAAAHALIVLGWLDGPVRDV
jgi:hypothetical protein